MFNHSNTNRNPAMHNFKIHHHKKLDKQRIILQKNWNHLSQFSIYYGFEKLDKKLKSNMWSIHGNGGKRQKMLNNWKLALGQNRTMSKFKLNERQSTKRRRFLKNPKPAQIWTVQTDAICKEPTRFFQKLSLCMHLHLLHDEDDECSSSNFQNFQNCSEFCKLYIVGKLFQCRIQISYYLSLNLHGFSESKQRSF